LALNAAEEVNEVMLDHSSRVSPIFANRIPAYGTALLGLRTALYPCGLFKIVFKCPISGSILTGALHPDATI
jgi:hypothetical protein